MHTCCRCHVPIVGPAAPLYFVGRSEVACSESCQLEATYHARVLANIERIVVKLTETRPAD